MYTSLNRQTSCSLSFLFNPKLKWYYCLGFCC